jgi:NADH-quinone oxidoreductase subunit G
LLIGVNPRYEGSKLNLKLRSRYLKGGFNIIQIGSLINLTFSNTNISSNSKILTSLVEGNNLFCQEFTNSLNPILISNTEILKRKDSLGSTKVLNYLSNYIGLFSQSKRQVSLNVLNPSLSDVGIANLNGLKTIKANDLKKTAGIYFINNSFSSSNIKKLLSLKLLNFFQNYNYNNKMLITQTSSLDTKLIMLLKKGFNISNHLHLPNTVFFEGSGTYLNTEGNVCKVTKVVKPLGQAKSDWQIIRKMLSYSKKTFFLTNPLKNNNLAFNSERFSYFKNYLEFQHYALSKLSNLAFSLFKVVTACPQNIFKFKAKRAKLYNSQIRF